MDRLLGAGDVAVVCREHGLAAVDTHPLNPPVWMDDQVKVTIVSGYTGWQVSVRDGMGGLLVCEVGADTRSPELLRLAITEARRVYGEVSVYRCCSPDTGGTDA